LTQSDPHWAAIAERLMAGDAGDVMEDAQICASSNQPAMVGAQICGPIPLADQDDEQTSISPPDEFPPDCLTPPGLIGQIVKHTLAVSLYPQPELALAAAIGCVATLCGHKIRDPQNTRTNIYLVGIDETTTGKDIARRVVSRLLKSVEPRLCGPETVNSAAALASALKVSPIQLMLLDEAGYLFASAANRNATHMANLVPTLLKLFTSSAEMTNVASYNDQKHNVDIDQPNLSIYATSTPKAFWQHITLDNVSDGLIGRMLVIPGRGCQKMQETEWIDLPDSMIEAARWWWKWLPGEAADHMLSPAPIKLQRSKAAHDRYWQYANDIADKRIGEESTRSAIWGRAAEKANKLALIHCASRHVCTEPQSIEIEDIEWGIKVVNWLTRQLIDGCNRYVARNQQERYVKTALEIIGKAGSAGIGHNDLTRAIQFLPRKARQDLMADLIESGQVQVAEMKTAGRPKLLYRLANRRHVS
jgi:hypothetical protein